MTRRVGKCGRTLRPQPRLQGFYQSVHTATTGLRLNLTHNKASSCNTSAASQHGQSAGLPAQAHITICCSLQSNRSRCHTDRGHKGGAFLLSYAKIVIYHSFICFASDLLYMEVLCRDLACVCLENGFLKHWFTVTGALFYCRMISCIYLMRFVPGNDHLLFSGFHLEFIYLPAVFTRRLFQLIVRFLIFSHLW